MRRRCARLAMGLPWACRRHRGTLVAELASGGVSLNVRVRLTGGLAVEVASATVDEAALPGRQGRLALTYLVCNRTRPVPRAELADLLWSGMPPPAWEASLSAVISRVRAALASLPGEPLVTSAFGCYQFTAAAWVDVEQAAEQTAEAETALRAGATRQALRIAAAAADLAGRPLLPGHEGGWVDEQRGLLRGWQVRALEVQAQAAADCGDPGAAVRAAGAVLRLEPFRETAHQLMIRAHVAAGNRAEAVAAYVRCRAMLADELGVDPSPQTESCYLEALRLERLGFSAPSTSPLPAPLAVPERGAFVGRDHELARVRKMLDEGDAGRTHLALVTGEPGIGKSRLAKELAEEASVGGTTVLFGRCDSEQIIPYQPFVQALHHVVAGSSTPTLVELTGSWAPDLVRLIPELSDRLPEPGTPLTTTPDTARYRLFEAVAAILAGLRRTAPVLLLIDDLQWADQPTLLLLRHVLRSGEVAGLVVMTTCRDGEVGPDHPLTATLADLHRDDLVTSVPLGRLDIGDVEAMLDGRVGLAREVHRVTAGNPFFVRALARHLADTGAEDLSGAGVPTGVADVVRRRLALQSADAQRSLVAAAVIGRRFALDILARATRLSETATLAALEQACAARLVVEDLDAAGQFSFVHDLVREAVVDQLGPSRRALLHRSVGEALATLAPESVADLARHFCAAGPTVADRAAGYAVQAAEAASGQLAHEDAARYCDAALAALPNTAPALRRGGLHLALGDACAKAGDPERANRAFAHAADAARIAGDAELLARCALGAAATWGGAGRVDQRRIALLDEALDALGSADHELRALLLARLAGERYWEPDPSARDQLSAEAVAVARRLDRPGTLATCLEARNYALWGPQGAEDRLHAAREIVALAQPGHPELTLVGHAWGITTALEMGDRAALDTGLAAYATLAAELRQPRYRWYAGSREATRAILAGDFDQGAALARDARDIAVRSGEPDARNVCDGNLFPVWVERPDPTNVAAADAERARYIGAVGAASPVAANWGAAGLLLRSLSGDDAGARRMLDDPALLDPAILPRDYTWRSPSPASPTLPPACATSSGPPHSAGSSRPPPDTASCAAAG